MKADLIVSLGLHFIVARGLDLFVAWGTASFVALGMDLIVAWPGLNLCIGSEIDFSLDTGLNCCLGTGLNCCGELDFIFAWG